MSRDVSPPVLRPPSGLVCTAGFTGGSLPRLMAPLWNASSRILTVNELRGWLGSLDPAIANQDYAEMLIEAGYESTGCLKDASKEGLCQIGVKLPHAKVAPESSLSVPRLPCFVAGDPPRYP